MTTEQRYGPQVEALLVAIERLTTDQQSALYKARDETRMSIWYAAWNNLYGAMEHKVALDEARREVAATARHALRHIHRLECDVAVLDTLWALIARDQIGDEFTQEDYDLLTTPWRTTIGSIHPDDANLLKVEDML